jgi:hypothetical protein
MIGDDKFVQACTFDAAVAMAPALVKFDIWTGVVE